MPFGTSTSYSESIATPRSTRAISGRRRRRTRTKSRTDSPTTATAPASTIQYSVGTLRSSCNPLYILWLSKFHAPLFITPPVELRGQRPELRRQRDRPCRPFQQLLQRFRHVDRTAEDALDDR